jgi:hypothetical protein
LSESQTVPEPVPSAEAASGSFFGNLVGVFIEPRTAFTSITRQASRWWLPVVGCMLLNGLFAGIWLQKVDTHQFIKTQIEESGRADKIPADRYDQVVNQQAAFMKPFAIVIGQVAPWIGVVVLGAVLLFVYRFFYSGSFSFTQSLSVVAWQAFALALVSVPLILIVLAAKGDWNVDPATAVGANLTLLFEKGQTAKWLYSLAGSIDLFSFWSMFLLASGYGVLVRKPTSGALWGVVIPWAIWVLGKVGIAALMS